MKGSQPKTQTGAPRYQDRGIRTAIIISRMSLRDLDDMERDGKSRGVERDVLGKEIMAEIRAAKKYTKVHKSDLMYLVYEVSGEIHLAPLSKDVAGSLKKKALEATFALGKFFHKVGSFFNSSDPDFAEESGGTVDDVEKKQRQDSSDRACALTGLQCGLSTDASGGLVISQLYFGEADSQHSTQGESNDS